MSDKKKKSNRTLFALGFGQFIDQGEAQAPLEDVASAESSVVA